MKFSIKTLLAITAYAAILAAGLTAATNFWGRAVFLVTFMAVPLAAVAALFGDVRRRAAWAAFALVTGGYLYVALLSGHEDLFPTSQWLNSISTSTYTSISNPSPYAPVTVYAPYPSAPVATRASDSSEDSETTTNAAPPTVPNTTAPTAIPPVAVSPLMLSSSVQYIVNPNRKLAGHCALATFFGLIAGVATRIAIGGRREREAQGTGKTPAPPCE